MCPAAIGNDVLSGRTDLDSHANMVVVGRDVLITARSGKTAEVQAFAPELDALSLPLVECVMLWECPFTDQQVLLVAKDAVYVETMDHNLVPPFMLREAGVIVDTTPKIHATDPDTSHHSLYWPEEDVRIPLSLHGIFSYFKTRKPTMEELQADLPVVSLTPSGPWDPSSTEFAKQEEAMTRWDGEISNPRT